MSEMNKNTFYTDEIKFTSFVNVKRHLTQFMQELMSMSQSIGNKWTYVNGEKKSILKWIMWKISFDLVLLRIFFIMEDNNILWTAIQDHYGWIMITKLSIKYQLMSLIFTIIHNIFFLLLLSSILNFSTLIFSTYKFSIT